MLEYSTFENKWFKLIQNEILKKFPDYFINDKSFTFLPLPGKSLMKGSELFGNYEIIDIDGRTVYSTDKINELKYILYSNRTCPTSIKLVDKNEIDSMVAEYEDHLDNIIKMVRKEYTSQFHDFDKFETVINKIFRLLNLHRY